jgi:S1-C subfamily serine protease
MNIQGKYLALILLTGFASVGVAAQNNPGYGQDSEGKPRVVLVAPKAPQPTWHEDSQKFTCPTGFDVYVGAKMGVPFVSCVAVKAASPPPQQPASEDWSGWTPVEGTRKPVAPAPPARQSKQQTSQSVPPNVTSDLSKSRPLVASPRKDIPTIAKAANGAIVTIVMADNDKPLALGTGFLVTADGVIVTNYHVIKTGSVAVVKFPDGTVLPVDGVLAADKVRDLAVIKIHGQIFRTLTLGNSDHVQIGEEVVAIGNPLGLELTVSNGILSAVRTSKRGGLLQITAPISHGSSGGPLFNMSGEVVGITSSGIDAGENLNFAIPVNDARLLLEKRSATVSSLPDEAEEVPPSKAEPSVKTEPATPLQKDILWMNHFLSEHSAPGNTYIITNLDAQLLEILKGQTHDDLTGKEDCAVTIHREKGGLEGMTVMSFTDIDPAKIDVFDIGQTPILQFITFSRVNDIIIAGYAGGRFIPPYHIAPNSNIQFDSHESAEGFSRMFKHAVALCGESSEFATKETLAAPNNPLPPNTKVAATPIGSSQPAIEQQLQEDMTYCYQHPANSLQTSNGGLVGCSEINASRVEQEIRCKADSEAKTDGCGNFLKFVEDLKAGRL